MSYYRIIPRDLFNESKLLKCLGQLALNLHDRPIPGVALDFFSEEEDFRIKQDESSGALYCSNLELIIHGRLIGLRSPYNSKDGYPLQFMCHDREGRVFSEKGTGEFSVEFLALISGLKAEVSP